MRQMTVLLGGGGQNSLRELREINMADQAILETLVLSVAPSTKYSCSKNRYACSGPDKASLGLALIGSRKSRASLQALSTLVRYQLDGELSESFSCQVLEKQGAIAAYIRDMDVGKLERRCVEDVRAFTKRNAIEAPLRAVCADAKSIVERRDELLKLLKARAVCNPEDF